MLRLIRLEIENARLEAAAKQQANRIEALQKGAQESAMVSCFHTHILYRISLAPYILFV